MNKFAQIMCDWDRMCKAQKSCATCSLKPSGARDSCELIWLWLWIESVNWKEHSTKIKAWAAEHSEARLTAEGGEC